jgi:signal peptide peptidase SppA
MSGTFLALIAERVINQPLMILPEKLAVIAQVLEGRISIDASDLKVDAEHHIAVQASRYAGEYRPVSPGSKNLKPYRETAGGTALIPVMGSLVNRGGFLQSLSGITSYEGIKHQVSAAAADREISTILLDIDSGGGEAVGAFEVADAVRAASLVKPVYAVANGLCCSAAYAIASGASRIISSRSSLTGSIGTAMLHLDHSKMLSDMGIKPTLFVTGKRKQQGHPMFELSDEVKGELRSYINRVNQNFLDTVTKHRGVSQEKLLAMEAGVFIGAEGIAQGLVDEVGTFEGALSELHSRQLKPPKRITMNDRTYTQTELDQAIASAKADGHKAGVAEGTAAGVKQGMTAQLERIKTVQSSEAYKGREASANHLLFTTELDAAAIGGAIAGLAVAAPEPKDQPKPTGERSQDNPGGLVIEGANAKDKPKSEFELGKEIASRLPAGLRAAS